jgi:hypothetical protein
MLWLLRGICCGVCCVCEASCVVTGINFDIC